MHLSLSSKRFEHVTKSMDNDVSHEQIIYGAERHNKLYYLSIVINLPRVFIVIRLEVVIVS